MDMMDTSDGSMESEDERLHSPMGDSYDALVPYTRLGLSSNVDVATCAVDKGQDECHDSPQDSQEKLVREGGNNASYTGNANRITTDS